MKAGDLIYNSSLMNGSTRAEVAETLAGFCFDVFDDDSERFTNGDVIDAMLLLIDIAVTPDKMDAFRKVIQQYEEDISLQPSEED